MPSPLLIQALRDHLIAQGIVRDPRTAGPLPPCWRSPRKGVPAPSEGTGTEIGPDSVVGLMPAPGVAEPRHDATYLRTDGVDIVIRSRTAPQAVALDDQIRTALTDKRGWTMGGLTIIESNLYRPQSLITSDDQAFTFVTGYTFQRST